MECAVCGNNEKVFTCSKCHVVAYCGKAHQKEDWKKHKVICAELRAKTDKKRVEDSNLNIAADLLKKDLSLSNFKEKEELDSEKTIKDAQLWTAFNSVMLEDCNECVTENEVQFSKNIWQQMKEYGFCMLENFLEASNAEHVEDDVLRMHNTHLFRGGQIVKQGSNLGQNVRTDTIAWADLTSDNCKGIQALCKKLDRLVKLCSELGGKEIESRTKPMVSCYAGNGAHYKRHIDNPSKDGRCLTCIYYLNRDWNPKVDGGNLCIYPKDTKKKVVCFPLFNKIIIFFSDDRNPHEVLPTFKKRFAITCWYFDKDERESALAQYANSSRSLTKEVATNS